MNNWKPKPHAPRLLAAICLSLMCCIAIADESGWYVGAGFGAVKAGYSSSDFDDGSISQGGIDDDDTAWKLFGGYRFNRYVAVEAGYVDLTNETDKQTTFSGVSEGSGTRFSSLPDGPVNVDIDDITGVFAAVIGNYPLTQRLMLNGKIGHVYWEANQTTLDLGQRNQSLDGTNAVVGVGAEYRFDNGIAIRGEAERYFDIGETDQDVLSLAMIFRF